MHKTILLLNKKLALKFVCTTGKIDFTKINKNFFKDVMAEVFVKKKEKCKTSSVLWLQAWKFFDDNMITVFSKNKNF